MSRTSNLPTRGSGAEAGMDVSELEVRVRYAETDQMGVAHHASYLVWFEAGRTEFIRSCGRSYAQIEADGWLLVVVEARCRYLRPARYDDLLTVRTRLASLRPATLEFGYEIVRKADGDVIARGATLHAAVDRTGRPRRIPPGIRRMLGVPAVYGPARRADSSVR
ncbi:MAG TPA: thioesterase family protein [bacterium]|nr:thioesterase family protein [bacterium]